MSTKQEFHDEYQFPQDDYNIDLHDEPAPVASEAVESPIMEPTEHAAASGFASIWANHKRTLAIVGVVVAVGVVFAVMRATHKPADAAPTAPAQSAAPMIVQQPIVDPQMAEQLNSLKADSVTNGMIIRQLQTQVQQLTGVLNQTRAQQQQLNQTVGGLVSQVQLLNVQIKILTAPKPVKVDKPAPQEAPAPVITYQLRAVVPGRAWIVASDGQSQSVAVGDHVQQYGTVQSIDADAGVVITTSGKTIKF